MKIPLLLCALATSVFADPVILPRITAQELAKLQQTSPMSALPKPVEGETKVRQPSNQSIIKESTILRDGSNWTLIPRGAVVFLPEALKNRVNSKPTGTLLTWTDFLARNLAWITTTEVSFDQASGTKPLQAERVAFWTKHDKVVIATHQDGPISIRPTSEPLTITQR